MPGRQPESERGTRQQRIDPKLRPAWRIVPFDSHRPLAKYHNEAVTEYPTQNGPADYALIVDGKILGIVEGKKVTLGPQNVLTQAERYSKGAKDNPLNFNGFHVPFLYSTNGEMIWFHDVRYPRNRSHRIAAFHTPDALAELLAKDFEAACRRLHALPNNHPSLRPYQLEANVAIEQALAEHKRQMLVAMATGTGKTFTLVNQIYRLMKSGVGRRILFLVDRRALAAQAVREFASFEAEPGQKFNKIYEVYSQSFRREDFDEDEKFDPNVLPKRYLTAPQPGQAFVYVCTIQRMMINLFGRGVLPGLPEEQEDEDEEKLDIPIHAFDIIIADECHRGYTAQEDAIWRQTLDHFDAIKIGLTATPAAHTKAYFKDVVYRYEYERAVREGYLVDYDVVTVRSNVRVNGLFLKAGEHVRRIDTETGDEHMDALEDERQFDTTDIERKITAPDSNRKILEEVRKYGLGHEERYGRFPKTLIFAVNDLPHISHADQLVDLARDVFGRGDAFVQKITGRVDRPLQRIREFRNRPDPGVVVTVDLLSTGVDIPDLEYIVFLRPVKSRILFEQMLGRGTRKGFRFPDKSHFTVFDCFDGTLLAYFRHATSITVEPPDRPTRTISQVISAIWENQDREYNIRCLVKRLHRVNKEISGEGRERFSAYLGEDIADYARVLPRRLTDDFGGTMAVLRDPALQVMLTEYPRAPRTFYVADEAEDTVTSDWMVREEGKEYKPEDYLATFARFVRQNPAHIEAIEILLDRPHDWGTEALKELRQKLTAGRQRFTIANLQKAYQVRYHKALVDLISMIKRAAREDAPLLTPEERVDRAIATVTAGQQFTEAQQNWLVRIRDHLVENLSIDRDDFDLLPVFERVGGWGKANSTFGGKLATLLKQLNGAIAA